MWLTRSSLQELLQHQRANRKHELYPQDDIRYTSTNNRLRQRYRADQTLKKFKKYFSKFNKFWIFFLNFKVSFRCLRKRLVSKLGLYLLVYAVWTEVGESWTYNLSNSFIETKYWKQESVFRVQSDIISGRQVSWTSFCLKSCSVLKFWYAIFHLITPAIYLDWVGLNLGISCFKESSQWLIHKMNTTLIVAALSKPQSASRCTTVKQTT